MHLRYANQINRFLLVVLVMTIMGLSAQAADPVVSIAGDKTTVQACGEYFWPAANKTYTESGIYTFKKGSVKQVLNLKINRPFAVVTTISSCDAYHWVVAGKTYYTSGTYTYTSGCSEQILELTIAPMTATAEVTKPINCFGEKGEVKITVQGGTPPFSGAGYQPLVPGTFAYTVVDKYGCVAMTEMLNTTEPSKLEIVATATADLSGAGSGTAAVTASGGAGFYEYDWNGGQLSPAITGLSAGKYSVKVTDANGCTATAQAEVASVNLPSGHATAKLASAKPCPVFTAFPNPAHDQLQIRFDDDEQQLLVMRMADLSGRVVRELHIVSGAGENFHEVELSGITPGIYVVSLMKNEENASVKTIVVQ